jgi:hypothetical protein
MIAATTIRNFHASVLQLLGFDHERFTVRHICLDLNGLHGRPGHRDNPGEAG